METSQSLLHLPILQSQEESAVQENKDLLLTLPKERYWSVYDLYQFQGFWFVLMQLQGFLALKDKFQAQASDMYLASIPKSGTTWLKAIMFAIRNRVLYPPSEQNHPLLAENPHKLVPSLEFEPHQLNSVRSPRLLSTHLSCLSLPHSIKDLGCKIVYLCRNPKDNFISLWHQFNKVSTDQEFVPLEDAFEKFCRGVSWGGPFWDHVLGYWKESLERPQQVLFLTYEDMKAQPLVHVRRLAEFLGYPFSPEEEREGLADEILNLCNFDNLSNLEINQKGKIPISDIPYNTFFRRGEMGDHVNYLTPEMINRIDLITQHKFHGSGLQFKI